VGIDHSDEEDAPTPVAERVASAGAATEGDKPDPDLADSAAERMTEHTRYRAFVDASTECEKARKEWAEALPEFRAAWEDHVTRYPHAERTRLTVQDDGSCHGDGVLLLSTEENAEINSGCERIREVGETIIVPAMLGIEAEDGGRYLIGFEHRFKEAVRLKEKVADQVRSKADLTPVQALELIPDAVRFTLQYPDESYAAGVRKDIERLQAHGFIQVQRRSTWTSGQYKGINSRWEDPQSGLLFEVQFHTSISFEAKQLTHEAYERIRAKAEPDPELPELEAFQDRICAMIPVPPGAAGIEDYSRKKRDGRGD
jgi:hypothetical protein